MTITTDLKYTVRFEYSDGQQYDSGIVWMTPEQAGKVEALLNALAAAEQVSDVYVGEYHDWEKPLEELIVDIETEFRLSLRDTPEIIVTTTKAKLEFVWAMSKHTSATVRQCEALMRYAGTLQRLAEDDCNVATDDAGLARREGKRERIQQKITQICVEIGPIHAKVPHGKCPHCKHYGIDCTGDARSLTVPVFSGDPRGAVLKIRVPDGYSNSFGGEGICVPA